MIARAASFTAAEVHEAIGGRLLGAVARRYAGVSTDTRDSLTGLLFVALVGERHDAHDHLAAALAGGAAGLLVSETGWTKMQAGLQIGEAAVHVVPDTLFALGELAKFHHRRLGTATWALTGSNGKTTTKELLAAILSESRPTLKTEGNLNNLIGVPLTLLGLNSMHRAAVVEMGMNRPGEIARYTEIAEPDVGLVINVGPAHIGELGSLQAIADAKGELFRGLGPGKVAVVNADDPLVVEQLHKSQVERHRTFGRGPGVNVQLLSAEPIVTPEGLDGGQWLQLSIDGLVIETSIPFAGAHNALNAAAAAAAATALPTVNVGPQAIRTGLPRALNVGRRLAFEPIGPFLVVDDCYNANSASMLAALETVTHFGARAGRRVVAVLGEMRELGDYGPEEHHKVGMALKTRGVPLVAVFGPLAAPMIKDLEANAEVAHESDDLDRLYTWLRPRLLDGDLILVKGSRGAKMERVIQRLRDEGK
jgi:UDP-N-acetylmuramoyl-tripeptide--D-alanyl-D-alanine ligase